MENKIKHLEMIQVVINRMASNSFMIKGWSVAIVSALFALAAKEANYRFVLIGYFAVFMFWILDGYYLYQERLFRKLYENVRANLEGSSDFSMKTNEFEGSEATWACSILSKTMIIFHGILFISICAVMFLICKGI